ncbi:MAG: TonB-dependent receptor, partial [Duncaniella sp.]|nr:TonB-dependent receptor [Duncaniella sp.]
PVNSPMLGMTDFSTIPSFFVDGASLLHGASSVTGSGGGLGGAISLSTAPEDIDGTRVTYVQGVGSFHTFDEYARVVWSNNRWNVSTRVVNSSSRNDYTYINHDRKENIYDDDHNIVGQYYPRERNTHGSFRDSHLLQEVSYNSGRGDRARLAVWLTDSRRELPMLSTDYGSPKGYSNEQRERAVRAVLSWDKNLSSWHLGASAGYIHSSLHYDYSREVTTGSWTLMTRSRSRVNTYTAHAEADWQPSVKWLLSATADLTQHFVKSSDLNSTLLENGQLISGYDKGRAEVSAAVSARYRATDRLSLSVIVRQETSGSTVAAPVPALFAEWVAIPSVGLTLKTSATRNHRFPSLNDLYFMPGGNPRLRSEQGFTWDLGASTLLRPSDRVSTEWNLTWFDSRITDWIQWLPTPKGFFSPRNVKEVHSYGLELKGHLDAALARDLSLRADGNLSLTRSINCGTPMSAGDKSIGKQLPYIPEWSSSLTCGIDWRQWSLLYKWCYYSERFTMSSNDHTLTGHLPAYIMNNVTLGRSIATRIADLNVKLAVNNLFNEDYLSVLSRPMPGINFELFLTIIPRL